MKTKNSFFGIEKKVEESDWEFCFRCIRAKQNKEVNAEWQDLVEHFELPLHRDSLRKSVAVGDFSAIKVAEYYEKKLEDKLIRECVEDQGVYLGELEAKKMEIYKERVRLQDVKREINKGLRVEARIDTLLDAMINGISKMPNIEIKYAQDVRSNNEASVLLSDLHIGKHVDTPHNKFNLEVARERIEKLAVQTIKFCRLHDVSVLNIDILGDCIENNLHLDSRVDQSCDAMEQILHAGEYISRFIELVSPHVNKVNLHSVTGNHDRLEKNYKLSRDVENFTRLIDKHIELRTGLKFERSNTDSEIEVYTLFNGKTVALQHGHNLKGGIDDNNKVLSDYLGMKIDYSHIGHFHSFKYAKGTICNGCLCGSDKFSNKLRYNDNACQALVIYYEDGTHVLHNIILN